MSVGCALSVPQYSDYDYYGGFGGFDYGDYGQPGQRRGHTYMSFLHILDEAFGFNSYLFIYFTSPIYLFHKFFFLL